MSDHFTTLRSKGLVLTCPFLTQPSTSWYLPRDLKNHFFKRHFFFSTVTIFYQILICIFFPFILIFFRALYSCLLFSFFFCFNQVSLRYSGHSVIVFLSYNRMWKLMFYKIYTTHTHSRTQRHTDNIYNFHHRRDFRSSYRKLTWMGFEPPTTAFCSNALTGWAMSYQALSSTRTQS